MSEVPLCQGGYRGYSRIRTHTALGSYRRSLPRNMGPPWERCVSVFANIPCTGTLQHPMVGITIGSFRRTTQRPSPTGGGHMGEVPLNLGFKHPLWTGGARLSGDTVPCTGVPRSEETATPLGPPQDVRHRPTVGS